jgi:hypothetical protein
MKSPDRVKAIASGRSSSEAAFARITVEGVFSTDNPKQFAIIKKNKTIQLNINRR